MKRLLLLFVLSPVILFGQTRRKEVVDSIKAATVANLKSAATLLGNIPGSKVENMDVVDSGEYFTIFVRVHVAHADIITAIHPLPAIKIKTGDIAAGIVSAVTVPSLPPAIIEAGPITSLPILTVVKIKTGNIVADSVSIATVPTLPPPVLEAGPITSLPTLPAVKIRTGDIATGTVSIVTVPSLPHPVREADSITSLSLIPVVKIKTRAIVAGSVSTATVPSLPAPVAEDTIIVLRPFAVFMLNTAIPVVKVDKVSVPPLPVVEPELTDALPLFAAVKLPIEHFHAHKMDTVAVPNIYEKKMPVAGMHLSTEGYSLLEKMEGFSPELYSLNDGGFTIGFGFFVPYEESTKWEQGVKWEEAERIIRQKVPLYEDQVKRYINVQLTQNEFDALTMLAYNLGGFSKATSIVNDVNTQTDIDKLQSDWNRFIHSKAPGVTKGLMNRRKDEMGVKKYSDYQPERKIQILTMRRQ